MIQTTTSDLVKVSKVVDPNKVEKTSHETFVDVEKTFINK